MSIKRPDTYEHNNPKLPFVLSKDVKGGALKTANLETLLSDFVGLEEKLEQGVTKVYVESENTDYRLINIAAVALSASWINDRDQAETKGRFEFGYACSDEESNLISGVAKIRDKLPYNFRLASVQANVNTSSTGSAIVVNILKNNVTIFTSMLIIDANETSSLTSATPYEFATTPVEFEIGDDIQIDLEQVGIMAAGIGLKVKLLGHII